MCADSSNRLKVVPQVSEISDSPMMDFAYCEAYDPQKFGLEG
jgi:hypothetical protein